MSNTGQNGKIDSLQFVNLSQNECREGSASKESVASVVLDYKHV